MVNKNLEYLDALRSAIKIEHKCNATHKETVFVHERTSDGQPIWEGDVEVFKLASHNKSKICYAWQHTVEKSRLKIFAILENNWINSPSKAVQAALFIDAQPPVNSYERDFDSLKHLLWECEMRLRKVAMNVENLYCAIEKATETTVAVEMRRRTG